MKRLSFVLPVLLCAAALALSSCVKSSADSAPADGGTASVTAAVMAPADDTPPADGADEPAGQPEEAPLHLRGIMNDMRVNVRGSASLDGEVLGMAHLGYLFTVTGFSEETVVGGTAGRWVHVDLPCNDGDGWIFSEYIDVSEFPQYAKRELPVAEGIAVKGFTKDAERYGDYESVTLELSLPEGMFREDDGTTRGAYKYKDQAFYTFWLRKAQDGANAYVWYEGDQTVRYLTSAMASEGGPGGEVSDDFNYLVCDVGSAPGIRGVEVIDLNTETLLFRGAYYHDFEYEGNEITIVGTRMRETDAERKAAADRYNEDHPYSAEEKRAAAGGLTLSVIELYRYNFVTNEYRSLGLKRIITQ